MHVLKAISGPLTGQRFDLSDDEVVLGRENATITLNDEETSRRHATIRIVNGGAVIEDLGSTNGTYVDGRRIDKATPLTGSETIRLGQSTFELEIPAPPPPIADPGSTRIAARPEPIADPDRTTVRDRPTAPPPPPEPIADPDRTSVRNRAPAPPPEPIADPDRTALRDRPAASGRPPARAPEPPADADKTSLRPRPRAPEPAEPAEPPVLAEHPTFKPRTSGPVPAPVPARAAAEEPFGSFSPPTPKRRRGIASRKLAPAFMSYAAIITTAAALVVYFAGR